MFIDDYSRYNYLYLIHEKSQSLNVFKSFKAEVELQLGKKIKTVKSNCGSEYYESVELFSQYTMLGKPSMNDGEALKITVYILNRVSTKAVNKIPYELWVGKKSSIKNLYIWGCPTKRFQDYKFYDPTSRSFLETENVIFLEKVELKKEENIRNVVFEEESVNDIGQVVVHITVQETTLVIGENVQIIVPDIVLEQDYMRKFIKERRHAIPDDYIVFLQEHEYDIGLTEDDPINFCQAMQSSNSKNGLMP
ncbi:hypothetical protein CR513_13791, partial [Mucuna pruriens]